MDHGQRLRDGKSVMVRVRQAAVAGCTLMLAAGAAEAARGPSCPPIITACGCAITKAGTYTVANELTASQSTQDVCIEITASYSILNLKGFALVGDGDGIGIAIRNGVTHAVVVGGDEGPATPPDDAGTNDQDFPSAQAVVTRWDVGIQDEGDYSFIALFRDLGGNIFQQTGNATAGILFKGAKNSVAGDFRAAFNGQAGVIVRNSSGVRLFNLSAINNRQTGVWFDHSDDGVLSTATAASNDQYGIWLFSASRNLITDCNGTTGNGDTGILLGDRKSVV